MRTTITLDDDVAAAVEVLRRQDGVGINDVVNRLIRAGLVRPSSRAPYRYHSSDIGLKSDVTNVGGVLGLLDEH